jgi:hypothetical protein
MGANDRHQVLMMRAARTLTTIAATGFIALAAGHVVQNGGDTDARIGVSLQSPGMANASVMPDIPELPRPPLETLQATPLPTTRGWADQQPASLTLQGLDRSRFGSESSASCAAEIKATPSGNGMIRVSVYAPCNGGEPVTLRHAGLGFTEINTDSGHLTVELPAMSTTALVDAVLQSGETLSTQINIPDADAFQRVVLVWRGESGLHIHAQEFGAQIGTAGHKWAGAPGQPGLGANAQGGYVIVLGARDLPNGSRAEVYTFPVGQSEQDGVVRLSVQAEINNTNCGGMLAAETLQPDGFGGVVASDLTLRVPDCNKVGEYLVLKNILRDLKIAHN